MTRGRAHRGRAAKRKGFLLLIALLAIWEIASRTGVANSVFLPPPTRVLAALQGMVVSLELPGAIGLTVLRCMAGYVIAAVIGVSFGIAMGRSRSVNEWVGPLVETLRPIPSAAAIPAAIALLGIGEGMKAAVVVFGSLWPILLNTIHGTKTIDPLLEDAGRIFSLTPSAVLRKVVIPAALPSIATGLRISLAIALILAITVEMLVGGNGLGCLILDYERSFRYAEMFAGIFSLGLTGFLLNSTFVLLERKYLAWSEWAIPST